MKKQDYKKKKEQTKTKKNSFNYVLSHSTHVSKKKNFFTYQKDHKFITENMLRTPNKIM